MNKQGLKDSGKTRVRNLHFHKGVAVVKIKTSNGQSLP